VYEPKPQRACQGLLWPAPPKAHFLALAAGLSSVLSQLNKTPSPPFKPSAPIEHDCPPPRLSFTSSMLGTFDTPGRSELLSFTPVTPAESNYFLTPEAAWHMAGLNNVSPPCTASPKDSWSLPPRRARRTTGLDLLDWAVPGQSQEEHSTPAPASANRNSADYSSPLQRSSEAPACESTPLSSLGLSMLPADLGRKPIKYFRDQGVCSSMLPPPSIEVNKGKAPTPATSLPQESSGLAPKRASDIEHNTGLELNPAATTSTSHRGWIPITHPNAIIPFVDTLLERNRLQSKFLYNWVIRFANHKLDHYNVEDLGILLPTDHIQHQRFHLNSNLRQLLTKTCWELQDLVNGVSQYLLKALFTRSVIDPRGHLLQSCHGIKDLNLLSVNFRKLTHRMSRAEIRICNFEGLDEIYTCDLSPIQTMSSWNKGLESNCGQLSPTQVSRVYSSFHI
jgi:hypothetical protein